MEAGRSELAPARAVLRRHWGHPEFRPRQRPAVRAVLAGRDLLAVLPTGGGKSVCFQVPALLLPGITLVVSPLISLMEDQVAGARRRGVPAAALTSASEDAVRRQVEQGLRRTRERGGEIAPGTPRLLYVSPERLGSPRFARLLSGVRIARLAVDEAHCISEWGHDFRPDYRRIAEVYGRIGRPPVAAFTATATPRTRRDVRESLDLRRPALVVAGVDRPNLRWAAERIGGLGDAVRRTLGILAARPGAAIVYLPTRRRTIGAAEACRRRGIVAEPYHAGMQARARREVQERFLAGTTRVVCATNAFGMGVDHPSVRTVLHVGIPGSLEAYIQESGRAGRDGEPALCWLISHGGDRRLQREMIRRSWPPARWLVRAWRALEPGRAVRPEELTSLVPAAPATPSVGDGDEPVAAALRLLVASGVVRQEWGTDGVVRYRRGPDALRACLDPGVSRRGRRRALRRLRAVRRYVVSRACRRAVVARWFGEPPPACDGCDRCFPGAKLDGWEGRASPTPSGASGLAPAPPRDPPTGEAPDEG